nr:hypothetical protein [Tanacetum cinerariifolium]
MARLQFCDYHNMVAILEKGEFNTNFHPMVDFIAASPLRYALTVKPTIFVSHIREFWSTARIETTDEGTHILATIDGIQRTVSEASLRRNLKLRDEDGIGEGSGTQTELHHIPFPEVTSSYPTTSSIPLPSIPTAPIPTAPQPKQLSFQSELNYHSISLSLIHSLLIEDWAFSLFYREAAGVNSVSSSSPWEDNFYWQLNPHGNNYANFAKKSSGDQEGPFFSR